MIRRRTVLAAALAAPAITGRAAPATIRFGQIESLTGPSGAAGTRGRDGARLAIDQVNAGELQIGGATYQLEVALGDLANDPKQAITLLRQYAAQAEFVCAIGPTNSVGYVPIVPVAEQVRLPLIGDGSGVPIKAWNEWAYRVNPVNSIGTPVLLKQVVAKDKVKKLAVIYDQTQDGQRADADVCKAQAPVLGYELVAFEAFRTGDPDFSPQIATVRSARPDVLFIAAAPGDGIKVVPQVREAGLDLPLLTGSGSFQDPVYWTSTKGAIAGGYTWLSTDIQSPAPALKAFLDAFRTKFGQQASTNNVHGADAVFTLVHALKLAGRPDRDAVQQALAHIDFLTPIGTHIKFDNPPSGDNATPTVVPVQVTGPGTYVRI